MNSYLQPGFDDRKQVHLHLIVSGRAFERSYLYARIRIATVIFVCLNSLDKILLPKPRVRFVRKYCHRAGGLRRVFIEEFFPDRSDDELWSLMNADLDFDRPGFYIALF